MYSTYYILFDLIVIGIPSAPIVTIESYPGNFILVIHSSHAGVPSDDITFKFLIVIRDNRSQVVYNKTYSYPGYLNNQNVTVRLSLELPKGTYDINITAINKYGSSEPWKLVTILFHPNMLTSSPTPTTTSTPIPSASPTTTSTYVLYYLLCLPSNTIIGSPCIGCIAGGGVAGGVIVIVILVVVVIVIVLIVSKKKKRKYLAQ